MVSSVHLVKNNNLPQTSKSFQCPEQSLANYGLQANLPHFLFLFGLQAKNDIYIYV